MNRRLLFYVLPLAAVLCFFSGCVGSEKVESISETELFTIKYGSFEEQLSVSDLNRVGSVRIGVNMKDGFFYVVDGASKKIMELNSYGDLLSLFYNEDSDTKKFIDNLPNEKHSVHHELSYPFDYPGEIAVDSQKCIYVACTIPSNLQEQGDNQVLYSQTVLRFARDGSFIDYIGQQGPGGTPFPYIKNIYTNQNNELIVVCLVNDGISVYWFEKDGFLKYLIPVTPDSIPENQHKKDAEDVYFTIENIIPDTKAYKLYVKTDYYQSYLDADSHVQSGINYTQTLLYPFDIIGGVFEQPVSVPPYEESYVQNYSKLTYRIPYDFLGVTDSGWKFFIVATDGGFNIEMIQNENQKILRRHFDVSRAENIYNYMSLSSDGIITALYVGRENARVVWYRTDSLIDAVIKN